MRHLTRSRIPRKAESTNYSIQVGEGILLRSALLYPFLLCENCGAFFISGLDFCLQDSKIKKLLWPCPCQRRRKNALDRNTCFCQGRIKILIRGATLIHSMTCALSRIPTYPRQVTSACNVAEYFVIFTFDCALSGPFDNLFLT